MIRSNLRFVFVFIFIVFSIDSKAQVNDKVATNGFLYPIQINEKWGYIDSTGRIIVEPQFYYATDFVNGLGLVEFDDERVGFLNTRGEFIAKGINPQNYKYLHYLCDDLLAVCDSSTEKFGFIDRNGQWIIPPKYYEVMDFSDGLAAVWENADVHVDTGSDCGTPVPHPKWGFIDKQGDYVIPPKYYQVSNFMDGYAVSDQHIIDKKGIEVSIEAVKSKKFLLYRFQFFRGLVYQDQNIYVPNNDENFVNELLLFENQKTGGYGYLDWNGNIVIEPLFTSAQFFSEDIAAVEFTKNNWGYIDLAGKTIIDPKFTFALPFSEGLAPVIYQDKWGFIDKKGAFVVQPIFDEVHDYNVITRFWGGFAKMVHNNKMCYINRQGKIIWSAPK